MHQAEIDTFLQDCLNDGLSKSIVQSCVFSFCRNNPDIIKGHVSLDDFAPFFLVAVGEPPVELPQTILKAENKADVALSIAETVKGSPEEKSAAARLVLSYCRQLALRMDKMDGRLFLETFSAIWYKTVLVLCP